VRSWRLPNGLEVSERLSPIGVVGANFEARPNVAVDVATQVLKSGNAVVLRTGSAALGTVTALVDRVLRPALADAGADEAAVGLVRSAEHAGAEALVSLPGVLPLVILRGSGASTAALARTAAAHGVRALAHAEGGGVLYAHETASPERLAQIARASLDRLGVCNRLNLALVDRAAPALADVLLAVCRELGLEVRSRDALPGAQPLDRPLGHEWASEPERVETVTLELVDGPEHALRIANDETSGLAAAIVTEDAATAQEFLDGYRGTAALWNASTRFVDGFALHGTPETGINVDRFPGPRGPVIYRDLCLRQYRIVGDGSQHR
jgi:glutamate-5-semialdehyde dehydrogenase